MTNAIFHHTADRGNTDGSSTVIDHPLINGRPGALLTVTHRSNLSGDERGVRTNAHFIAVVFRAGRWSIVNVDGAPIPLASTFAVSAWDAPWAGGFVHFAASAVTIGNVTSLDHPLLNGRRSAVIFVTPRLPTARATELLATDIFYDFSPLPPKVGPFGPDGFGGYSGVAPHPYVRLPPPIDPLVINHPIGVWYNEVTDRWNIFNADWAAMSPVAEFNVEILDVTKQIGRSQTRVVVSGGDSGFWTEVPLASPRAARYLVAHNISFWYALSRQLVPESLRSARPVPNLPPTGVWWDPRTDRPAIFHEDGAPMLLGTGFNVRYG